MAFLCQVESLSYSEPEGGLKGDEVASVAGPAHLALLLGLTPRSLFRRVPRCPKGRSELLRIHLPRTSVNNDALASLASIVGERIAWGGFIKSWWTTAASNASLTSGRLLKTSRR